MNFSWANQIKKEAWELMWILLALNSILLIFSSSIVVHWLDETLINIYYVSILSNWLLASILRWCCWTRPISRRRWIHSLRANKWIQKYRHELICENLWWSWDHRRQWWGQQMNLCRFADIASYILRVL